jgi:CopG antitoxin of type II toxin-antitoxin system
MESKMKTEALPQTDSIQEMAQFWDTHDVTNFEDELEEVDELVFERRTVIALDLESAEAEAVRKLAESKGVADEKLIRGWVREKIGGRP